MNLAEWLADTFAGFGGFLAVLLAITESVSARTTRFRIFFGITLVLIGILQLLNILGLQKTGLESSTYARLTLPVLFLIGPISYFALCSLVEEDFRFGKRILLLIPFLSSLVLIFSPSAELFSGDFPWKGGLQSGYVFSNIQLIAFLAGILYSFGFGVLIFGILAGVQDTKLRILIWISALDFIIASGFAGASPIYGETALRISGVTVSLALSLVYYVLKKYGDLEETIYTELVRTRYARSRLAGLPVDSILAELERMMKVDKLFQEENVTLGLVAEKLSLSSHQLSELINQKLNSSFFSWLNRHRVEEAKFLLERTEKNVLEVAMEVGFNNRSSFNEAFLKFAGTTPVEFRRRARASSPSFSRN
ncbi:AraC family transcriptional regulator [Leptospira gomenensis]|uniref:AraC family transcriptional regulator n=1 Tax=Leptospira gomenensis TaxID=2484974 RepID=A0A5F1Y9J5_9LEPT|nr:AraC family transcriptional regulator [Leptospira gomenensis]TGK31786.1 AraC family transcriptional regulator [Leptospira gomenensis]TGK34803.1 AraC family transcriptional regulator [Leptospira gomenensis]TGK41586.1 AraC family transcriptional regulator [Leptospira gomenensis]TGK61454.1 AraC family transcriptional regulator [Leptospira gomenensis]